MKVYLDLVWLLNTLFDFLILLSVSYILKRDTKIFRVVIGSLVGSLSTFFILYNFSNSLIFILKIILSFLMIFTTFSFKNFKYFFNNLLYLYLCSIVLGGGLYLINTDVKLNIIIIVLSSPFILFFYVRQTKKLKYNYNNYYRVEVLYEGNSYYFTAFLDSGNKLKDQYKKRPIILVNTDKINFSYEKCILVPYTTVNGIGILKCLETDKVIIDNNIIINKALIGLSNEKFNLDGINMILNNESL